MKVLSPVIENIRSSETDLEFIDSSDHNPAAKQENYDRAIDSCLDILDLLIELTSKDFNNSHLVLFLSKLGMIRLFLFQRVLLSEPLRISL
jgi:hypothetical protein